VAVFRLLLSYQKLILTHKIIEKDLEKLKMKAFEFITSEEWENLRETFPLVRGKGVARHSVNKLLNEKKKNGWCQYSEDSFYTMNIKGPSSLDTHNAFIFVSPIEEEVVECGHVYQIATCSTGQNETIYKWQTAMFCPKCGKKLEK